MASEKLTMLLETMWEMLDESAMPKALCLRTAWMIVKSPPTETSSEWTTTWKTQRARSTETKTASRKWMGTLSIHLAQGSKEMIHTRPSGSSLVSVCVSMRSRPVYALLREHRPQHVHCH